MTLEEVRGEKMNVREEIIFNRKKLGKNVWAVLRQAQAEKRLTCGLLPAIKLLEHDPDRALFCILSQSGPGDTARHIHTVLLQAFCYENDIHILKVDSAERVNELVHGKGKHPRIDSSCLLVHQPGGSRDAENSELLLTECEKELVKFCDTTLDMFPQPVIKLPAL
ncbi:growth arrest and DNA damage-inducible protein GADD45 gamma [Anabrus simplex]|uniref:growth arrest and DNA damage-inducible protein GADD45 gamma n=1 Tax=Anabrus simplex TaxID=316456 RepID=UPI0034DD8785